MIAPSPPTWNPYSPLYVSRRNNLPSLPYGKTVRIGDYARQCVARKNVALALNHQCAATARRERQLALILILLAIAGLFSES